MPTSFEQIANTYLPSGAVDSTSLLQNGGDNLHLMAVLHDPESGRVLELSGTQPSVQVYTGNWLSQGEFYFSVLTFPSLPPPPVDFLQTIGEAAMCAGQFHARTHHAEILYRLRTDPVQNYLI